jgi:ABC-type glutathione transport system ATPase component
VLTVKISFVKIKQLKDEKVLLDNINFNIDKNKIYTIVGKNGAGKSTLINSLTKLLRSNEYQFDCKVEFFGKDLYSINDEELRLIRRDKIKYVFQDAHKTFDQLKTLKYYFNNSGKSVEEIEELLSFFQLPNSQKLFPLYPYEISGGMAQRVSFILALLAKPNLLILDEPSASVDAAIANLFLLKLKEFVKAGDNSVLIISQDLLFAEKVSDKIAFLSNGKLSEFLSPSDFFELNKSEELEKFLKFYELLK